MARDVYEEKIVFDESRCDANGNGTIGDFARFMEAATRKHVEELGVDTIKLVENGTLWVICWSQININRMPKKDESVILKSWPGAIKYGLLTRRFKFSDESGNTLAEVSSTFTIIDAKTRSQTDIPEDIKAMPVVKFDDDLPIPKMSMSFPENLDSSFKHEVKDSEIDINGHVNNAFYLEWAYSALGYDYISEHPVKSIWIEYSHEIRANSVVDINYKLDDNVLYLRGFVEGEKAYSVRIELQA